MSSESDIQSILELVVLNNYTSLILITSVVYDCILTFPREVEYIWCKPWTWVSTMFVAVRYIGLCWIMGNVFLGTSFILGPPEQIVIYQISGWAFIVFLSAADLMMILRVYAMWNRSRIILSILLFIFMLQTIFAVVLAGIYDTGTHLSATTAQVLDFSFCSILAVGTSLTLQVCRAALRLVLSAALVISAVSQTLKQSFEMYQATKQWQPNRYMQRLLGDGILYFTVNVAYQIYNAIILATTPINITSILLTTFLYTTFSFYILIPRFIINIRELYDRDIHGRFHIDTGFGMQLQSNAGPDATVSAVVLVDGNQAPEVEDATGNLGDLETGGMHGLGLNEDFIESGE